MQPLERAAGLKLSALAATPSLRRQRTEFLILIDGLSQLDCREAHKTSIQDFAEFVWCSWFTLFDAQDPALIDIPLRCELASASQ
jgi:hypothetical protein